MNGRCCSATRVIRCYLLLGREKKTLEHDTLRSQTVVNGN